MSRRLGWSRTNFLEGIFLLGGFIPGFLAFVFTATRCAAFLVLVLALMRLADFLGAELTFVWVFPP